MQFANGGILGSPTELPDTIQNLFLDYETASDDPKQDSLHPWHTCRPIGAGVTWDDHPNSYFVTDLDLLASLVRRSKRWVNHNVKYDAHVHHNCVAPLPPTMVLECTVVTAKLLDSDRAFKGGYGLDALALAWLKEDISGYEEALKLYLHQNKDYGRIPIDILAEYACQDVMTNRRLYKYIKAHMPEDCSGVYNTELQLTSVLFDIEQRGMAVDMKELRVKEFLLTATLIKTEQAINEILGRPIKPNSNTDCHEVLCGEYGLPVLQFTDTGNPSFDKHALRAYKTYPHAPQEILDMMLKYRELDTLKNFFVVPYQKLQVDGLLHSQYNQVLRTGRLSCKWPNSQQLNKPAKELIHPRPGHAFVSYDYSQIEFRFIVHYIQDPAATDAYNENPDTDFHEWVAEMCGIPRKPAKTVNFMIAFGGGKKRTVKTLSNVADIIADLSAKVQHLPEAQQKEAFDALCLQRALQVYDTYHASLPGIKSTSRRAESIARHRGYVRNLSGRRRHLPSTHCHTAFNTLNQSSAADLLKERTVAVSKIIAGTPIGIVATVHDETVFEMPIEVAKDGRTLRDIMACMEDPAVKLRVPVRGSMGLSLKHWREAGSDEATKKLTPIVRSIAGEPNSLSHLKCQ